MLRITKKKGLRVCKLCKNEHGIKHQTINMAKILPLRVTQNQPHLAHPKPLSVSYCEVHLFHSSKRLYCGRRTQLMQGFARGYFSPK